MPAGDDPIFGELLTEISEELSPFREKIAAQEQVRCALALSRQKRIAEAEGRIRRHYIDGIGEMVARIDADVYHRLGLMHGYETIRDPDFLRILLRDNPECRVKSGSPRVTLRVQGLRDSLQKGGKPEEESAGVCTETELAAHVDTTPQDIEPGEMKEA
jgi:hypothetical protein